MYNFRLIRPSREPPYWFVCLPILNATIVTRVDYIQTKRFKNMKFEKKVLQYEHNKSKKFEPDYIILRSNSVCIFSIHICYNSNRALQKPNGKN